MDSYQLLSKLIAIKSVFPDEIDLSAFLEKRLAELGFTVEIVTSDSSRRNIVATFGSAKHYLALYGHMDTVTPDPHYSQDPYKVQRDGNVAHGLGVADMKGGIVAILQLAQFASSNNLPVKIVFGVDEENISQGAHDLVNAGVLGDVDFLISAESGQVKDIHQQYSICYGRRGRIAVRITVKGKRAHAAESHKAINAITSCASLVTLLSTVSFPQDRHLGSTNMVVHSITGAADSFSVPDECSIVLSALTTPSTKHSQVIQKLEALARDHDINVAVEPLPRPTPYGESYAVDPDNVYLKLIEKQIFAKDKAYPMYAESVADENIFANRLRIPVISLGPVGGGDHTADEWVSLASIDKASDTYERILQLYCGIN